MIMTFDRDPMTTNVEYREYWREMPLQSFSIKTGYLQLEMFLFFVFGARSYVHDTDINVTLVPATTQLHNTSISYSM